MVPYAGFSFYCFESVKFLCMKYAPQWTCNKCEKNTGKIFFYLACVRLSCSRLSRTLNSARISASIECFHNNNVFIFGRSLTSATAVRYYTLTKKNLNAFATVIFRWARTEYTSKIIMRRIGWSDCAIIFISIRCDQKKNAIGYDESRDR